jgi:hypothetical protein
VIAEDCDVEADGDREPVMLDEFEEQLVGQLVARPRPSSA